MISSTELCALVSRGGVIGGVPGDTPEQVYQNLLQRVALPQGLDSASVLAELCEREKVLSTAVGNGIAIPHPRRPLVKEQSDERVIVCFLQKPIYMNAPDSLKVSTMFVLLSSSPQTHIEVLDTLAKLFGDAQFRKALDSQPSQDALLDAVRTVALG